ncbi:hypothetical protein [Haladaptatus sp. T7]|uniref:hypothetical protein n=1 Tax=Haladaptatus sp. T7 TaxID=2029368 RepID=UPI00222FEA5B|nr:hypothetical protein [Haladaptatus sp. T7]
MSPALRLFFYPNRPDERPLEIGSRPFDGVGWPSERTERTLCVRSGSGRWGWLRWGG